MRYSDCSKGQCLSHGNLVLLLNKGITMSSETESKFGLALDDYQKDNGKKLSCLQDLNFEPLLVIDSSKMFFKPKEEFNKEKANVEGYYLLPGSIDITVKPEQAREIVLSCYHASTQREFNQDWSEQLGKRIKYAKIDLAWINSIKKMCLMDGQHRGWGISLQKNQIPIKIDVWMCEDEKTTSLLFNTFDSNKKRSLSQSVIAATKAGLIPDNIKQFKGQFSSTRCSQARTVAMNNFRRDDISILASKLDNFQHKDSVTFTAFMNRLVRETEVMKESLQRTVPQGILAGFFAMWFCSPGKAAEFIKAYFLGSNKPGDVNGDSSKYYPPKRLKEFMLFKRPPAQHGASASFLHAGMLFRAWITFLANSDLKQVQRFHEIDPPSYNEWVLLKYLTNGN